MEYVYLVQHMVVYHSSKEQREVFLGPFVEFSDRTDRKKIKDRNQKAYID